MFNANKFSFTSIFAIFMIATMVVLYRFSNQPLYHQKGKREWKKGKRFHIKFPQRSSKFVFVDDDYSPFARVVCRGEFACYASWVSW